MEDEKNARKSLASLMTKKIRYDDHVMRRNCLEQELIRR